MARRRLADLLGSLLLVVAVGSMLGATPVTAHGSGHMRLPRDAFLSTMAGGNTVGGQIREKEPRADGYRHLDTPAMIARLKQLHVTTYTYGIWESAVDWDDLRLEFAPAARRAGIDIMVYIVPPSECFRSDQRHLAGRCSRPFEEDYVSWAREIATLSRTFPNITSWAIDDFLVGDNAKLFTKDYLHQVRNAQDAVNPRLKWYVTLYYDQINAANLDTIKGALDGVIYPYTGDVNSTIDATYLERRLDGALATMAGSGMDLVLLAYTGRFLDGMIPPTESYVADVMRRAAPYLYDGRIGGIIAYGAPVRLDLHQPSNDYHAHSGLGRLSLSVGNFTPTSDGGYAAASQEVSVDPAAARKTLSFYHRDQDAGGPTGYQFEQVLVDGVVVWEQDAELDPADTWVHETLDLTDALAGKSHATLTFRLFDKKGVGWWPLDVAIDDVTGTGLTVRNGGFESPAHWTLSRNDDRMQPLVDVYRADRPARVFNAVGAAYAGFRSQSYTPVRGGSWPGLRPSTDNTAMYGNGRLAFTIPAHTTIPAGTCAVASQDVAVTPGLPRYELSFWHTDNVQARFGQAFKEIWIDGRQLWKRDVGDYWPWDYLNGSDHQGPIDVTDFVQGKSAVRLEFRVCADDQVDDLRLSVGFDHIETVGLAVANPEFEEDGGWQLRPAAPIDVRVERHGPPVPLSGRR